MVTAPVLVAVPPLRLAQLAEFKFKLGLKRRDSEIHVQVSRWYSGWYREVLSTD